MKLTQLIEYNVSDVLASKKRLTDTELPKRQRQMRNRLRNKFTQPNVKDANVQMQNTANRLAQVSKTADTLHNLDALAAQGGRDAVQPEVTAQDAQQPARQAPAQQAAPADTRQEVRQVVTLINHLVQSSDQNIVFTPALRSAVADLWKKMNGSQATLTASYDHGDLQNSLLAELFKQL